MVAIRRVALFLAICSLTLPPPGLNAFADDRDVVVVVHQSVQLEEIPMSMLRDMILGQRRFWPSGERVELVVAGQPGLARSVFVEELSGMTEAQFQHYWTSLIFSHRATRPPRSAPDRRLALALVNAIPGALTVVENGFLPDQVRVLQVEGWSVEAEGKPQP